MLSLFRRLIYSKVGVIVTLVILVLIALAFAAGDISGMRPAGGSLLGGEIASVGDEKLTEAELTQRAQLAVANARERNPQADMSGFIASGGLEQALDQSINGLALTHFGEEMGMHVSKRAIDGQIASYSAFRGLDGKFDQERFRQTLAQQRISEGDLRDDIRRQLLAQWLVGPTIGASQFPRKLALPYASLLLEQRTSDVGVIPIVAFEPAKDPGEAALTKFYNAHRADYIVPERRVVRYALVSPQRFDGKLDATDAEIAQAYRQDAKRFAPRQTRDIRQLIVRDEAQARKIAAQVKGGTSIEAAASAAGLEATLVEDIDQNSYANQTSSAIAETTFAADRGALIGPDQVPLGWLIARVEDIATIPGRTLEQARSELKQEVETRKRQEAMADLQTRIDDGIAQGATFDEVIADTKLAAQRTPAVNAAGLDPLKPQEGEADPRIAAIAKAGFAAEPEDEPQIIALPGDDAGFALVKLDRVLTPAPRPLKEIRDTVLRDYRVNDALERARTAAEAITKKVKGGKSLAAAMAESKLRLPRVEEVKMTRAQMAQGGSEVPPPLRLMFSMVKGSAKMVAAPSDAGWVVVHLKDTKEGDASTNKEALDATQEGLGANTGRELVSQYTAAIRNRIGVRVNDGALANLRKQLGGESTDQ